MNQPRDIFRKELENIKYKGYEVEALRDGRKIVITKPGGKFTFGAIKRDDFMVWVYSPEDGSLWLISHKDIFQDLEIKFLKDAKQAELIVDALERVYHGEDPDDILSKVSIKNPIGEEPELLLKAYKWIWGQEDINYPSGKGRAMSMDPIKELRERYSARGTHNRRSPKRSKKHS